MTLETKSLASSSPRQRRASTVSRKGVNKIDLSTKDVNKTDLSTNIMQAVDNARITAAMSSVNKTIGQSESDGQTYARSREWHLKEKKASSIPQDTSRTWHMVLIFCPTFVALVCSLSLSLVSEHDSVVAYSVLINVT